MIILVFSLLTFFCFLYILNLYLDGAKKRIAEIVLSFLILVTVIVSFFVDKWWFGLIAIASVFILVSIFKPIAKSISYKLLGYRKGIDNDSETMDKFKKSLLRDGDFTKAMQILDKENETNKKRLLKIYKRPSIRFVLSQKDVDFDEFYKIFQKVKYGLSDIIWDILNEPKELTELIELYRQNLSDDEIFIHFRKFK